MKLVVADASALAEYLLRTERGEAAKSFLEAEDNDFHTPALCDVEVAAVLRRALLRDRMSFDRGKAALADYLDLPLVRHGHRRLLTRMLQLRENVSAYDAAYVALAEDLGAALLTADRSLGRTAEEHAGLSVLPAGWSWS